MRRKVINIDNAFLQKIWHASISESPTHNRELCKNVYISLLHGVVERIRAKADVIMTSGVKRDDDVMDLFELSVKAEAMMNWYEENDTKWSTGMIDVDDLCRYIDEFCDMADHSYEFVKEAADATP
jgi:hypothetical protein